MTRDIDETIKPFLIFNGLNNKQLEIEEIVLE
jgi:hypothetical protein